MRPRVDQSLLDIAIAGRLIETFIAEADGPARLEGDPLLSSAIAWQLSIVGEAVKRLSAELRQAHLDVPWSAMARMRDRVTHGYDTIDWSIVWHVVTSELPQAVAQVEAILVSRRVRLPDR